MAAFKKARECGAPGIELDIHITADGKLVVVHDDNFVRTAPPDNNGNGKKPEELSYDEIKHIDVGSFFGPEWSAEKPVLLEEVLEEFCPDMYVDIELKSRKTKDDPLPVLLAETLKSFGEKVRTAVTVSSFNPFCLKTFKQEWKKTQCTSSAGKAVDISTAIIWCTDPEVPWILRRGFGRILSSCDYVKPIHKQINTFSRFRFSVFEKRPVIPWTVDDFSLAKKMINAGCEGIITNRPQDLGTFKN
ncbi:MAG: glycerophosphodiester phosphodiesterase [Treponema sp.]|nr:glycerophosphodiester phosphodiesterase [Treponema sp.]